MRMRRAVCVRGVREASLSSSSLRVLGCDTHNAASQVGTQRRTTRVHTLQQRHNAGKKQGSKDKIQL